jgi:SAM-dependent methyltransferase
MRILIVCCALMALCVIKYPESNWPRYVLCLVAGYMACAFISLGPLTTLLAGTQDALASKLFTLSSENNRVSGDGDLYALDHELLHRYGPSNVPLERRCLWLNMGYWKAAPRTLELACEALARKVAKLVFDSDSLNNGSGLRVFDCGFGCGDQLLFWLRRYGGAIERIDGVTLERVQHAVATVKVDAFLAAERARDAAVALPSVQLRCGDVNSFATPMLAEPCDRVIAMDCAYHFDTRQQFFERAADVLRERSGRLVLADIVVNEGAPRWARWLLGKTIRMPAANLNVDARRYEEQLRAASFARVNVRVVGDAYVLGGLASYLRAFVAAQRRLIAPRWLLRYEVMQLALRLCTQMRWLSFILVSADMQLVK